MVFPRLGPPGRPHVVSALLVWALLVAVFASLPTASAAGPILPCDKTGHLTIDERWDLSCPAWHMVGNVTVDPGVTLRIDPRVTVTADSWIHLYIRGKLTADGAAGQLITFKPTTSASTIPWGGVQFNASSTGSLTFASLTYAERAIYATQSSPTISDNVIDTAFFGILLEASSSSALRNRINYTNIAIQASTLGNVVLSSNIITNLTGNPALGIYVTNLQSASILSNTIQNAVASNGRTPPTPGGRGTDGGYAVGILVNGTPSATIDGNMMTRLWGGQGGNGAASSAGNGGRGGDGGSAGGVVTFGVGNLDVSSNSIANILGGHGGNGGTSSAGTGVGGNGGNGGGAAGVQSTSSASSAQWTLNFFSGITAGSAGDGGGGSGGRVSGLAAFHVALISDSNVLDTLIGGRGGNSFIPANPAGRGGDSTAFIAALVPAGNSHSDTIQTVTKGAAGTGTGSPKSYGVGAIAIGNTTTQTRLTLTNMTLTAIGDLDLSIGNYTEATTVNTPFSTAKFAVQFAANLTVRNFLAVATFWPNNSTYLGASHVHVDDDGLTAWDLTTPSGLAQWLLVTDRVYQQSTTKIHDNVTRVTVSYPGASFWSNPRSVDMATSHTENFGMVDVTAPTSSALPLPTYKNTLTFGITYTYDDGNGTGVQSMTLWYRGGGLATWTLHATQVVPNAGGFCFTASGDGTYEFYTTATDKAGNSQAPPSGSSPNNTWTIVDTVRPGSHVNPLPTYETTPSFLVSWAPDAGVTDIVAYRIQYNSGSGWLDWLADTHSTSGTFTPTSQGSYAVQSIARDPPGNFWIAPWGNDTWTIVDTILPRSKTLPLPGYETSSPFSGTWQPAEGTADIASYRIEVNDNGAGWALWIASTTATSGSYSGQDGHTYQFRSIATDNAGNVESKSTNDSWTIVDMSPPDSVVTTLPPFENTVQFTVS